MQLSTMRQILAGRRADMGHVIAIANHKGGTAKTTTTFALSDVLAERGRVLMVDADAQASLTAIAGVNDALITLADVISRRMDARRALVEISPTLHLLPASLALADVEKELIARAGGELALRRMLQPVRADYDAVIIDCEPGYSVLSMAALMASDGVLIPAQPSAQDVRGVAQLMATIDEINALRADMVGMPALEIIGVLPTFANESFNLHNDVIDTMQRAGWPVLSVSIPRSVKVQEASAANEPITRWARHHSAALAYQDLGEVIRQWQKQTTKRKPA